MCVSFKSNRDLMPENVSDVFCHQQTGDLFEDLLSTEHEVSQTSFASNWKTHKRSFSYSNWIQTLYDLLSFTLGIRNPLQFPSYNLK